MLPLRFHKKNLSTSKVFLENNKRTRKLIIRGIANNSLNIKYIIKKGTFKFFRLCGQSLFFFLVHLR